jgi:hypothetical protein
VMKLECPADYITLGYRNITATERILSAWV